MKNCTLGNVYHDSVTGFGGIATCEQVSLNDSNSSVYLEGMGQDGKPVASWVSSTRLISGTK
jgi:hypothetical protein